MKFNWNGFCTYKEIWNVYSCCQIVKKIQDQTLNVNNNNNNNNTKNNNDKELKNESDDGTNSDDEV